MRILLDEDNEVNEAVMLKMLDHLGCKADIASNSFEILQAHKSTHRAESLLGKIA